MARVALNEELIPQLDSTFEEVTETEEATQRERLKSRSAAIEAIIGTESRIQAIAKDLIAHFEERSRALEGKGLIVGMSRRIAVELYNEIVKLRPAWHSGEDETGAIKSS